VHRATFLEDTIHKASRKIDFLCIFFPKPLHGARRKGTCTMHDKHYYNFLGSRPYTLHGARQAKFGFHYARKAKNRRLRCTTKPHRPPLSTTFAEKNDVFFEWRKFLRVLTWRHSCSGKTETTTVTVFCVFGRLYGIIHTKSVFPLHNESLFWKR